jgi:thioredoxin 1
MELNKLMELNDQNFKGEVEDFSGLALVDFFAVWCGPCRMMAPIMEELSEEYKNKVKIIKMDVDANPGTAQKYGIMSIPTIILFKGGKKIEELIGAQSKEYLQELINKNI